MAATISKKPSAARPDLTDPERFALLFAAAGEIDDLRIAIGERYEADVGDCNVILALLDRAAMVSSAMIALASAGTDDRVRSDDADLVQALATIRDSADIRATARRRASART